VNGVNVSTFDDGLEEVILEFPSAGFNNSIYFSLPENGTVVDAKMKLTGLPFVLNQTIYPQISGIFDNTTIEGNSLVLGNKQNWWSNWSYRIMVELNAKEKQREDIIAELDLNFTKILNENGIEGNVDIDSIRVVEYDSSLQPIVFDNSIENEEKYLVPHKFSKDIYFNETRNVNGTLLWLARGITYTDEKRTYMLYFDTIDRKESKYLLNLYNDIVFSNHYSGASYDLDSYAYLNPFIDNVLDYSLPTKGAKDVKIADLNRDGYFDIVFANHYTTNPSSSWEINSYIYHGGKTIDKNVDVLLPTKGAEGVDIGDINGDGWLDVVFANYRNNGGATAITSVLYYNSPEGIDTFPDVNFSTNGAIDVTVGHLNQDNYLDIAFANYAGNTVTIYYGSAGGMAPNPTPDLTISVTTPYGLKIYDVSKDGYNDLLVVRTTSPSYIYNGTSTGMEATADVSLPTADSRGVDAADLNNDGYVDVIFANYASPAYIYYGPFGSTKTAIDVQLPTDDRTVDVSIGELNNDVYMDAVLPNYMRGSNI
ncbi:MAG: VCBS repeat-containing protein, partial [Candidatus Thermoplasmatota archaeon]